MLKLNHLFFQFPIILGTLLGFASVAVAEEESLTQLPQETTQTSSERVEIASLSSWESEGMEQVTNVNQLRDVSPTDWAFEALRSLVERYGCIAGYPDRTYRGNRAMTRFEFAAGLNACLQQIERLIATQTPSEVTGEDLNVLRRLVQEFEGELVTLGTRIDTLEARTATLEDNQFSTTTQLRGEAIFALADAFGDSVGDNVNTVLHNRVRLNLQTSFTGRDTLQTRLQTGNVIPFPIGTPEGGFNYETNLDNDIAIDILRYIFPVGNQATVQIMANNGLHHYYADTVNPFFEGFGGGNNALSRFAERNPIYRIGPLGAGAAVTVRPANNLRFDLGYISNTANQPGNNQGFFGGNYSAMGQVVYGNRFKIGLTYVRGYEDNLSATDPSGRLPVRFRFGNTGTPLANLNRAALASVTNQPAAAFNVPVATNSYGLQTSLQFSPNFVVNGWIGRTDAELQGLGDAEIWNYAIGLAFPNFGRQGNLLGLFAGAEPTLRSLNVPGGTNANFTNDFAYHLEAFYRHQLADNISITPGVIWLTSPRQNANNPDIVIGTIRTTFTF